MNFGTEKIRVVTFTAPKIRELGITVIIRFSPRKYGYLTALQSTVRSAAGETVCG